MATPMAISAPPAAARGLVLATGGFMPPRLMLARAGFRLPEGVRLVAPVVVTAAVPSGVVGAAASDGATGDESMTEEDKLYMFMEGQRVNALNLLSEIEPLPHLVKEMQKLKSKVEKCEMDTLIRLAYDIVDMAYKCSDQGMIPLPKETFVNQCRGHDMEDEEAKRRVDSLLLRQNMHRCYYFWPGVRESDADAMRAVMLAMDKATHATARYIYLSCGGTPP